jgi:hypothetical protein
VAVSASSLGIAIHRLMPLAISTLGVRLGDGDAGLEQRVHGRVQRQPPAAAETPRPIDSCSRCAAVAGSAPGGAS